MTREELNKIVFEEWEELKKSHKITNYKIATGIGVSNSSVHGWDKKGGKPTMASLKKLHEFFDTIKRGSTEQGNIDKELENIQRSSLNLCNLIGGTKITIHVEPLETETVEG